MFINFIDFWDGFDKYNNFFLYLFRDIYRNVEIRPVAECDYVIYSMFGNEHLNIDRKKIKKIFYTGENVRPNFNECDYSFTYDFNSFDNKNIRIPLYHLYLDWFNVESYGNYTYLLPIKDIDSNQFIETKKNKFCAAVFSNPHPLRYELMNKLSEYKKVDGYGHPFNNRSKGDLIKYKILSEYKFSICTENGLYDGYSTEKLLQAKTAGTIPIYKSNNKTHLDFNSKCFIDLNHFESLNDLKDFIIKIDNDESLYQEIFNQKLWAELITLDTIKNNIKLLIKDIH